MSPWVCRCIVQLTVLGYILVPIFTYNMWWLVLLYSLFMLYVGCLEAVQRPAYTYQVSTSPNRAQSRAERVPLLVSPPDPPDASRALLLRPSPRLA